MNNLKNKMIRFSQLVSQKSGLNEDNWKMGIQHNVSSTTIYNNKQWESKRRLHQLSIVYTDECFDIEILQYNNVSFELYWFENRGKRCEGKGGEILNHILDVCDELKVNLTLVPVPLHAKTIEEQITLSKRLINYYKSFDFVQIQKNSPQLIYHYKK